jgi:hypothetical protein
MKRPPLHSVVLLLSALLLAPLAAARVVDGLYSARIPVADRSDATLSRAVREGMSEVLVKVTGSRQALELPRLQQAVADARRLLQQYSYESSADGESLRVDLRFDSNAVRALVIESGAPLWTANRPPVLVWLVVDDTAGRHLAGGEAWPGLRDSLRDAFARRGVPLLLPVLDGEDLRDIAPGQAWRQSLPALVQASRRYPAELVLLGRAAALSDGRWLGDWLLYDGARRDRAVTADAMPDFIAAGVDMVADVVAGRFALASSAGEGGDSAGRIEVRGVRDFDDYAAIVAWLESLELIESADLEWLQEDRLSLRLKAQTDLQSLRPLIELNDRLRPTAQVGEQDALVYSWRR